MLLKIQFILISFLLSFSCFAQINSFPSVENFELNNGGWTATNLTNGTWHWGQPRKQQFNAAYEGPSGRCWFNGLDQGCYENNDIGSFASSPVYDFTNLQYPVVSFRYWVALEETFESVTFSYRIAGGPWVVVGGGNNSPCATNRWYNSRAGDQYVGFRGSDNGAQRCIDRNSPFIGGCSNGGTCGRWGTADFCLRSLGLQGRSNVQFAFTMSHSGRTNRSEGFGFDEFTIQNDTSKARVSISVPSRICKGVPVVFSNTAACADQTSWFVIKGTDTLVRQPFTNDRTFTYAFDNITPIAQSYRVKMILRNECGGVGDTTVTVSVLPKPNVRIIGLPDTLCGVVDTLEFGVFPLGNMPRVISGNGRIINRNGAFAYLPGAGSDYSTVVLTVGDQSQPCSGNDTVRVRRLFENEKPGKPRLKNGLNSICQGTILTNLVSSWKYRRLKWTILPSFAVSSQSVENDSTLRISLIEGFTGNLTIWTSGIGFCAQLDSSEKIAIRVVPPVGPLNKPDLSGSNGDTVCQGVLTSLINYTRVDYGIRYDMKVEPSSAIIAKRGGVSSFQIDWNPSFYGNASISLIAYGGCDSSVSEPLILTRYQQLTGIESPEGKNEVCVLSRADTFLVNDFPEIKFKYTLVPESAGIVTLVPPNKATIEWSAGFSGLARLVAKGSTGCGEIDSSSYMTIFVDSLPMVDAGPQSVELNIDASYQINARSSAISYKWMPSDGLSSDTILNPIASPTKTTTYTITATSVGGCVSIDTLQLVVKRIIDIPNVFFVNDQFLEENRSFWYRIPGTKETELTIFNRWGNKIYATTGNPAQWKGESNPDGLYYYLIEGKDEDSGERLSYKGWVEKISK